jgi:hypothetical protein
VATRLNLLTEKKNLFPLVEQELIDSTPERRRKNHRVQPVATQLNLLKEKKKSTSLSC